MSGTAVKNIKRKKARLENSATVPFLIMMLPGILVLLFNNYIPMLGTVMAFQEYRFNGTFIKSLFTSSFVGFKNFRFIFANPNLWNNLRNTILYNLVFIITGATLPVAFAIAMHEIWRPRLAKLYQTFLFLPYFLSWIIVAYLVYAFIQPEGAVNTMILEPLGMNAVDWYKRRNIWPFLIVFLQAWKYTGYNAVVYLAALSGINAEYYEAAEIDGVSKFQQIRYITVPMLRSIIIIMSLLAVGRIFNSDFGLFYNVPMGRSTLAPVTEVLDTFIYKGMRNQTSLGLPLASGFFQSVMCCITVVTANLIVRKIDSESSLF